MSKGQQRCRFRLKKFFFLISHIDIQCRYKVKNGYSIVILVTSMG